LNIPDAIASTIVSEEEIRKRKFGLRFINQLQDRRFVVDYSKPALEVYKDFLRFCIRRSQSLDILCRPWAPDIQPSLPTWIPRLSSGAFAKDFKGVNRRKNADALVGRPGVGSRPYSASRNYPASWKFPENDTRCLIIKGFQLDVIKSKRNPASQGIIPSDWLDAVDWTNHELDPPDQFWRTLVGNRDLKGQRPTRLWRRLCQKCLSPPTQWG